MRWHIEKCRFNLQTTLFCTNSSVLPICLSTSAVYHHAFFSHSFFDHQFVLQEEKFLNRIFIENSRQVNTSGIFITLSQKIICRLQSRGFGYCIGFRYMNESIFKNNIHHLKQKKSRNSKRIHTVSILFWLWAHVDWNNKKSNLQIVMRLPKHSTEVSTHLRS